MQKNHLFKKNDYVVFDYDGDEYNAKILDLRPNSTYLISICIGNMEKGTRLMQELVVKESQLKPINICIC